MRKLFGFFYKWTNPDSDQPILAGEILNVPDPETSLSSKRKGLYGLPIFKITDYYRKLKK